MDQDLPEALRLADRLDANMGDTRKPAAAELRRQHAEIKRLTAERDALRAQEPVAEVCTPPDLDSLVKVSEAGEGQERECPVCGAEPGAMCSGPDPDDPYGPLGVEFGRYVHRARWIDTPAADVTDAARLDFIEQQIRGSSTGVSFDWIPCWDGELSGYRMMWKRTIHDQRKTLREAIDVAMRNGSKA
jgi:hypothetical protein